MRPLADVNAVVCRGICPCPFAFAPVTQGLGGEDPGGRNRMLAREDACAGQICAQGTQVLY